jgi:stringent starvation protein B
MLSTKPYLVRAFYEWILDNGCTPYVAINATLPRCNVPQEHVENGEIVFNISPQAVRELKLGNDIFEFKASFSGIVRIISAPIKSILAIYAEENGQGMFFDGEEENATATEEGWSENPATQNASAFNKDKKQSHLRLVE